MPELSTLACADALDVTRPELYDFLTAFLSEMSDIFTDELLFLGGDELATSCFDGSPSIAAWMKAHGLNSSSTEQYFWQQMSARVFPKLNRTISVWRADDPNKGPQGVNMPSNTVFNVYQSLVTAWSQTIPRGLQSVVSIAGSNWYLDSQCGGYNQVRFPAWRCPRSIGVGV
jgi:hexosaminidase